MVRVIGAYLGTARDWFDVDYYRERHVPLAHRLLDPYGLRGVRLLSQFDAPPDDGAGLLMISEMLFDSRQGFETGLAAGGEALFADLKNFTDLTPLLQVCDHLQENA